MRERNQLKVTILYKFRYGPLSHKPFLTSLIAHHLYPSCFCPSIIIGHFYVVALKTLPLAIWLEVCRAPPEKLREMKKNNSRAYSQAQILACSTTWNPRVSIGPRCQTGSDCDPLLCNNQYSIINSDAGGGGI